MVHLWSQEGRKATWRQELCFVTKRINYLRSVALYPSLLWWLILTDNLIGLTDTGRLGKHLPGLPGRAFPERIRSWGLWPYQWFNCLMDSTSEWPVGRWWGLFGGRRPLRSVSLKGISCLCPISITPLCLLAVIMWADLLCHTLLPPWWKPHHSPISMEPNNHGLRPWDFKLFLVGICHNNINLTNNHCTHRPGMGAWVLISTQCVRTQRWF
jgi:hypothetical protein